MGNQESQKDDGFLPKMDFEGLQRTVRLELSQLDISHSTGTRHVHNKLCHEGKDGGNDLFA